MSAEPVEMQTRVIALASGLRRRILAGELSEGVTMPSVRDLARNNRVSTFTASRAYDLLVAEGLVDARRGLGYYVAQNARGFHPMEAAALESDSDRISMGCQEYRSSSIQLDAGCGCLPSNWLSAEEVKTALLRISRRPAAYVGRYGNPYGLPALRRHLTTVLAQRAIECCEEEIMVTQGASQALELCVRVLASPGETVLVDDPCYPYVLAMLQARGIRAAGIPRTAAGPDPRILHSLAHTTRARVFITNSTFHNPTGTTISREVADNILMIARHNGMTIVEDDIFSELNKNRYCSLASLDSQHNVIYVGSFSKTLSPNLRVGFIATSGDCLEKIAILKNVTSLSSSELTEQIVLSILTGGQHRAYLETLQSRLACSYEEVSSRLIEAGAEIPFQGAGIFIWAKLPTRLHSVEIMELARERGILLAPGRMFRPGSQSSDYFRFNVACANDDLLYSFISSLPR
jgi:DNA-binding transcriptional MocR family regulator